MKTIPVNLLRKYIEYDPLTGLIRRLIVTSNRSKKGWMAGSRRKDGYYRVQVLGIEVLVHRLALAITNGVWPSDFIDHEDGDPSNNVLTNLKIKPQYGNMRNKRRDKRNKTGTHNVFFVKETRQYRVRIHHEGKMITIGTFADLNRAVEARKQAEIKYGYCHNHGKEQAK